MQQDGAALKLLFAAMSETCLGAGVDPELRVHAQQLQQGMRTVGEVTRTAAQRMVAGEARAVLANATHYMTALSTLTVAWLWLWMADAATRAPALDDDFRAGKRQACRFWFATEFAQIEPAARLVGEVDRSALEMQSGWF